jgi:hypothetical protein
VLDIINNKYLDIAYTENTLGPITNITSNGSGSEPNTSVVKQWYVVIKYVNGIYLPLMRSNGKHYVNNDFLEVIKINYERVLLDKFKEPSSNTQTNSTTNTQNNTQNNITDLENHDEVDNILDCNTVSIFFNNTIPTNNISLEPIIKRTEDISFAIEDMIDIEEQESEPMGIPIPVPTTRTIPITPIESQSVTVQKENPINVNDVQKDAFTDFMNKIPMKSGLTARKSPKNTQAKVKSGITLEDALNTVVTNNVATSVVNSVTNNNKSNSNDKEELKPIGKYNLGELQHLAKVYKINTQKYGKAGKMINKTKDELYNEIKEKM